MREIFVCKIIPFDTNFFISIMFEHGCTKVRISQETIVDPFEILLDASLFKLWARWHSFLFWSFPISVAMRSSLLNYVLWNWEKVQCIFNGHLGWAAISFKRCPHVQQTMPSLQYDRHSLHCVLGSVSTNSNSSTLPTSWIIFFDAVLNGL